MQTALTEEYMKHGVFQQINQYAEFYKDLSFHIMNWTSQGTEAFINLDTYVYSSIQGTLESIYDILQKGRINDAYALLRKYYDSSIINVYSNLYLEDNFNIDNFVVAKIDNWVKGKERIPEYRIMSQYIRDSKKLTSINALLHSGQTYKNIRDRCNDHTHYNYYHNMLLNDNEIYLKNGRIKALDRFSKDVEDIFVQHVAYILYLKDNYMMSSDYVDSLEMGMKPEEGSENYVAPFIQEMFNTLINPKRSDIYNEIKVKTSMLLE